MTQRYATEVSRVRRLARKLYHFFWYTLALLIIVIAIAISLTRIFLPDAKGYRADIEKFASTIMGREVRIRSMDAHLDGLTPTFVFYDVHMLDDRKRLELVRFDQARIGFDVLRSIVRGKPVPSSLVVSGVDVVITRNKQGSLSIQGIDVAELEKTIAEKPAGAIPEQDELSSWFFERSHLVVENSRVLWRDQFYGLKNIQLSGVNVSLRNDNQRHQLTGSVRLPEGLGEGLSVAFDFTGNILVPAEWQGNFFAAGKHVQSSNLGVKPHLLHMVLHEGALDFQIWGGWDKQGFAALSGNLSISDVKLTTQAQLQPFALRLLNTAFDWQNTPEGWQLRLEDFRYQQAEEVWPATSFSINYVNGSQPRIVGYTSLIKLRDARNLLVLSGLLSSQHQDLLGKIQPRGDLQDLFVQIHPGQDEFASLNLSMRFDNVSSRPWQQVPGIKGVRGKIWLDSQRGLVQLDSGKVALEFAEIFRAPLEFDQLQAEVAWRRDVGGVQLHVDRLQVRNQDLHADAALALQLPADATSPQLDLQLHFSNVNAASLPHYYPVGIMDQSLVDWLDKGIVSGKVTDGGLVMRGRLADFPFANPRGVFEVRFLATDMDINYHEGWPHLTRMAIDGNFSGTGMDLYSSQAGLFESQLHDIHVGINEFMEPVLQATGKYEGRTQDILHFLIASPIAPHASEFYADSRFGGNAQATLNLQIPLATRLDATVPLDYRGTVKLIDNSLNGWNGKLRVDNLNGELEYSPQGLFGNNIRAKLFGGKTEAYVFTHNQDTSQQIKIGFNGEVDLHQALQQLQLPITDNINGRTHWAGLLGFGYQRDAIKIPGNFNFDSDLYGVELALPAPLRKTKEERRHFNLYVQFPQDNLLNVSASLDDQLRTHVVLDTRDTQAVQLHKATINFSDREPGLPEQRAIKIGGRLEGFDAAQWQAVLGSDKANSTTTTAGGKPGLPLEFDMDYLSLHTGEDKTDTPAVRPTEVPLVNGVIRELVIDDMQLGRFDIATQRESDGIRFDKLNFSSSDMNISGGGSWLYRKRKHQTNVRFDVDSPNVGNMLQQLGYSHTIRHGKAQAHLQLNWADAPDHFAFSKLNGTVGVAITDGTIAEVEAGAGRLLGLLSLSELPRHLLLNFKEFGKGLSFDEIRGSFDITDGIAKTDDLNVNAPVAVIGIRGKMGFATRDYDLSVLAVPRVTSSLTLISCLLTGGSTCGWVFFFDRIAGKKLDDSLAKHYTVTGAWENPQVKEVGKQADTLPADADKQ